MPEDQNGDNRIQEVRRKLGPGEAHQPPDSVHQQHDGDDQHKMPNNCQQEGQRNKAVPTKNVGIRLVMNSCRNVQYLSTMSTNNLIIRISDVALADFS